MPFGPMFWDHDALAELDDLRREMDRLFDDAFGRRRFGRRAAFPPVKIWLSPEDVVVTAEVPGIKQEDLDIAVKDNLLTLTGRREPEELAEEETYHRQERGHGQFSRTLTLPYRVDADQVEASYKNGVLRITLPRAQEDKPRKIAVKSA